MDPLFLFFDFFNLNNSKICNFSRFFPFFSHVSLKSKEWNKNNFFKNFKLQKKKKILETVNKLKDTISFINEVFSRATMDITKELWKRMKESQKEGKYPLLKYNKFFCKFRPRREF